MQNANNKKAFLILSYSECEWLLFWFLLCTLVILPEVCLPPYCSLSESQRFTFSTLLSILYHKKNGKVIALILTCNCIHTVYPN